jgi:signal recognition particle subunit SRP54
MREVRRALLEADVALEVVRGFTDRVREKAVGAEIVKSVKPGQMVVKIVHDELVAMLGSEAEPSISTPPRPVVIMMVGLQGSGKTTTTGEDRQAADEREKKKVLMASLDTRRPAAQEQLKVLGEQTGVATLPIIEGQRRPRSPSARDGGGASSAAMTWSFSTPPAAPHIDEAADGRDGRDQRRQSARDLLVADALTGQDAVNLPRASTSASASPASC